MFRILREALTAVQPLLLIAARGDEEFKSKLLLELVQQLEALSEEITEVVGFDRERALYYFAQFSLLARVDSECRDILLPLSKSLAEYLE